MNTVKDLIGILFFAVIVFGCGFAMTYLAGIKKKADTCDATVTVLQSQIDNRDAIIKEMTDKGRVIIEDGKRALAISEEAIRLAKDRTRPIIVRAKAHREIALQSHPERSCDDALREVFQ